MEFLNGRSLRQELTDGGAFDLARVQAIVPPLCTALQMAHDRGVLHRDLKPANIVSHRFDSGQHVYKIIDFDLANVRETSDQTRLTAEHHFVGTLSYASPEQLRSRPLEGRADLYSLGVVVFELLTGRAPFVSTDPAAVVAGHLTGEPPRVNALAPATPGWVDEVIAKALAKSPEDRWASGGEFGRALAGPSAAATVTVARPALASALADTYELGLVIARGRLGSDVYAGVHSRARTPGRHPDRPPRRPPRLGAVRARFLREAQTLQLAHPSILHVRDFGEDAAASTS